MTTDAENAIERIKARMREIEDLFEHPPFTPEQGRAWVVEYMLLEEKLALLS